MQRIIFFFIIFLCIKIVLFSQSSPSPILIISLFEDDLPFSFTNEKGLADGYLVDFWKLWAKKQNVTVNFVLTDKETAVNMVEQGYIHICGDIIFSPEKESVLDFSLPIIEVKTALFSQKKCNYKSLDEIKTDTIGVISNCLSEKYLKQYYPFIPRSSFKYCKNMFNIIKFKKINSIILDCYNPEEFLEQIPELTDCKFIETLYISKIRAAVKKNQSGFINFVNQGIKKINSAELVDLNEKWLIYSKQLQKKYFKLLLMMSSSALVCFIIIHYIILNRKVKIKTNQLNRLLNELENKKIQLEQEIVHKDNEQNILVFSNEELNKAVEQKTIELVKANKEICEKIEEYEKVKKELTESQTELLRQKNSVDNTNQILQSTIKKYEDELSNIKNQVITNIDKTIFPILKKLKGNSSEEIKIYAEMFQSSLEQLFSDYGINILQIDKKLTLREIEICNYIKQGYTSKEISKIANISIKSVDKHRENIRKKIGITNQEISLTQYIIENL